jgi:hypothetical protein
MLNGGKMEGNPAGSSINSRKQEAAQPAPRPVFNALSAGNFTPSIQYAMGVVIAIY